MRYLVIGLAVALAGVALAADVRVCHEVSSGDPVTVLARESGGLMVYLEFAHESRRLAELRRQAEYGHMWQPKHHGSAECQNEMHAECDTRYKAAGNIGPSQCESQSFVFQGAIGHCICSDGGGVVLAFCDL